MKGIFCSDSHHDVNLDTACLHQRERTTESELIDNETHRAAWNMDIARNESSESEMIDGKSTKYIAKKPRDQAA